MVSFMESGSWVDGEIALVYLCSDHVHCIEISRQSCGIWLDREVVPNEEIMFEAPKSIRYVCSSSSVNVSVNVASVVLSDSNGKSAEYFLID